MDEYRMARRVSMAEVSVDRVRGLGQQRDDGGGCAQCAKDKKEWRALVHM